MQPDNAKVGGGRDYETDFRGEPRNCLPASIVTADGTVPTASRFAAYTRWWHIVVFAATAAALLFAAALVMFSAFMVYDDEGYVLISLKNFAEHGGLYRDVYSQYGPFPFVLHSALHTAGLPFTHVAGRGVTLVAWAGAAIFCAAMVRQATRSLPATLVVLAAVFPYLWVMASEPSHPGGLITLLTAIVAAAGYRWLVLGRIGLWAVLAGAVAAALTLTKINVGGLVLLSVLAWISLYARSGAFRRWAPVIVAAGAVLVPLALMRPLLDVPWVQTYAFVFACSGAAAAFAMAREREPLFGLREFGWMVAAGFAVALVVVAAVLVRGTHVSDLIDGVLLAPMRHPASFSVPLRWGSGAGNFAVTSVLTCVAALVLRRRYEKAVDSGVAVLRLMAASGVAAAILQFPAASPDRIVFGFAAPCLWVFLWPLAGESIAATSARAWVGLLALGQVLHAFPVAGSQLAWGTFLVLPLAAVGAWEAAAWLAQRFAPDRRWRVRGISVALQVVVLAIATTLGVKLGTVGGRYRQGSDLALPGAEIIRLPSENSATYQLLTLNAAAHADVLFSEPGMFSFNLWSGVPPPTLANVTHWFSLLPESRQAHIVRVLESHPHACVIVHQPHLELLRQRGFVAGGKLHEYIARNFTVAFAVDGFEFRVREGREIAPLLLGEMLLRPNAGAGAENAALRLRLVLPPGASVARVEVSSGDAPDGRPLVFGAGQARLEVAPTDLRGTRIGLARAVEWPMQLDGPAIVTLHFDRFAQPRPLAGALIRLLDATGDEVALARLKQ